MKCGWCKQDLASDEVVTLLAMCEPISQEEAEKYGNDSFAWKPYSYVLTMCMHCAKLLDVLFGRLIKIDVEASCPFCNPQELCPTCYTENKRNEREAIAVAEVQKPTKKKE